MRPRPLRGLRWTSRRSCPCNGVPSSPVTSSSACFLLQSSFLTHSSLPLHIILIVVTHPVMRGCSVLTPPPRRVVVLRLRGGRTAPSLIVGLWFAAPALVGSLGLRYGSSESKGREGKREKHRKSAHRERCQPSFIC